MVSRRLYLALAAVLVAAISAAFVFAPDGDATRHRAVAAIAPAAGPTAGYSKIVPAEADRDVTDWRSATGDNSAN